jgi:hypothetical protein
MWETEKNLNFTDCYNPEEFPIDHAYRPELKQLIVDMLNPDWKKRPTAAQILTTIKDWPR